VSWRLRVRHTTTYHYSGVVHSSYNEARISPLDTANQFTLEHRVEVHPAANLFRYRDYWGSRVHSFDLHQPHTELIVIGSSLVETAERTPNLDDTVAWDAIDAPGLIDRFYEYLHDTTVTESDDTIRQFARELRAAPTPAAALSQLGGWLRDRVEYQTGTTSVSTTAVEALRGPGSSGLRAPRHRGAACRRHPRATSGYLSRRARRVVGEMHQETAWLEPGRRLPARSERFGGGRTSRAGGASDFTDVSPLKGVYHGAGPCARRGGGVARRVTRAVASNGPVRRQVVSAACLFRTPPSG
jgi:hypothetical protein